MVADFYERSILLHSSYSVYNAVTIFMEWEKCYADTETVTAKNRGGVGFWTVPAQLEKRRNAKAAAPRNGSANPDRWLPCSGLRRGRLSDHLRPTFQAQPIALKAVGLDAQTEKINERWWPCPVSGSWCLLPEDLTTLATFCDSWDAEAFGLLVETTAGQIRGLDRTAVPICSSV